MSLCVEWNGKNGHLNIWSGWRLESTVFPECEGRSSCKQSTLRSASSSQLKTKWNETKQEYRGIDDSHFGYIFPNVCHVNLSVLKTSFMFLLYQTRNIHVERLRKLMKIILSLIFSTRCDTFNSLSIIIWILKSSGAELLSIKIFFITKCWIIKLSITLSELEIPTRWN